MTRTLITQSANEVECHLTWNGSGDLIAKIIRLAVCFGDTRIEFYGTPEEIEALKVKFANSEWVK